MGFCSLLGRCLLAVIFISAGINKLQNPTDLTGFLEKKYEAAYERFLKEAKPYLGKFEIPTILSPKTINQHSTQIMQVVGGMELFFGLGVVLNIGFAGCMLGLFIIATIFIIHNPFIYNSTREEQLKETLMTLKNLGLLGSLWLVGSCQNCKPKSKKEDTQNNKKKSKKE